MKYYVSSITVYGTEYWLEDVLLQDSDFEKHKYLSEKLQLKNSQKST